MKKEKPLHFHIVTLFPESFNSYIESSIIARALKSKLIKISFYNPRDFAKGKLRKVWPDGNVTTYVDDRPYGGGPGMILRAEPILSAVSTALSRIKKRDLRIKSKASVLIMSPSGKQFTNTDAEKMAKSKIKDVLLISGRYEGIDARVQKITKAKEVSVGPYVLTGGELPALILIDAISRRVPGVLGKLESLEENRVSSSEVYTRPDILEWEGKKYKVPNILKTGDPKRIDAWKKSEKSEKRVKN